MSQTTPAADVMTWAKAAEEAAAQLAEAEKQLIAAKRRVWKLRVALKMCQEFARTNAPWPTDRAGG